MSIPLQSYCRASSLLFVFENYFVFVFVFMFIFVFVKYLAANSVAVSSLLFVFVYAFVFVFKCLYLCLLNTWQQILLQSYQRVSSRPDGRLSCLRGTVCCAP